MNLSIEAPSVGDSFRSFFDEEFGYVCRALRRLGIRERDLEDVAQELFVTVHAHFAEYDETRAPRPWLFAFALRFAANYRRLARHDANVSDAALADERSHGSDAEARDLVLRALETLDFDRRVAIVMHDLEGFSAPEIASQIGIPLNTVYSRIRIGRAEFRSAVAALQSKGDAP